MKKDIVTRFLHAALALAVVHQLVVSNFMQAPLHGKSENQAFEFHETVGLVSLGIVVLFWIWTLLRRGGTPFSDLYPWFNIEKRRAVGKEARELFVAIQELNPSGIQVDGVLSKAIHGMGLIAVFAVAVSGAGWLIFEESNEKMAERFAEMHEAITTFVWAYLIGHAGMAVVHEARGHPVLSRMFSLGRR